MKFIQDLSIDAGLCKGEFNTPGHVKRRLVPNTRHFRLEQKLGQIGEMEIEWNIEMIRNLLQPANIDPISEHPKEIRIHAVVTQDPDSREGLEEVPLFIGHLCDIDMKFGQDHIVKVTYRDPLIATLEQDGPEEFHCQSIEQVLKKILDNSFKNRPFRLIVSGDAGKCLRASNRNMTDFQFISEICKRYAFQFYVDPKDEALKLFIPDFQGRPDFRIDARTISPIQFRKRRFQIFDRVKAIDFSGQEYDATCENTANCGEQAKTRLRERENSNIELVTHLHLPNATSTNDLRELANGAYINQSWDGCELQFYGKGLLDFGKRIEVIDQSKEGILSGTYTLKSRLMTSVTKQIHLQWGIVHP